MLSTNSKPISYSAYRDVTLKQLFVASKIDPSMPEGIYSHNGVLYNKRHVLPVRTDYRRRENNSKENKIAAIKNLLGVDISELKSELHRYAHHLNSSQLLCFMVFGTLTDKKNDVSGERKAKKELVKLLSRFGIQIQEGAKCQFEYSDGEKWNDEDESKHSVKYVF